MAVVIVFFEEDLTVLVTVFFFAGAFFVETFFSGLTVSFFVVVFFFGFAAVFLPTVFFTVLGFETAFFDVVRAARFFFAGFSSVSSATATVFNHSACMDGTPAPTRSAQASYKLR